MPPVHLVQMTKAVKRYVGYLSDHIAQKATCHLAVVYSS